MRVLLMAAAAAAVATAAVAADQPFKVGETTMADVIGKMGKPSSITTTPAGDTIITFMSIKSHTKAATFIPVVGLFAGGAKSEVSISSFTFGSDGKLKAQSSTATANDCKVAITGVDCHPQ